MNKKLIYGLPLLCLVIGSVIALIGYYGLFSQEISVTQPISVEGDMTQSINCFAGDTCPGEVIIINNEGMTEREIIVSNDAEGKADVSYLQGLELTKKTVDFTKNHWAELPGKVNVSFVIIGEEFSAEVIDGSNENYVLIYYKDNSDRFNSPAQAILVENVEGNLPYEDDKNADEYEYCDVEEEYLSCHGAKIWYVPSNAITNGNLDWSRANEFYFETDLIQYNREGNIMVYPYVESPLLPMYTIDPLLESGIYTIETQVSPIE